LNLMVFAHMKKKLKFRMRLNGAQIAVLV